MFLKRNRESRRKKVKKNVKAVEAYRRKSNVKIENSRKENKVRVGMRELKFQ